MRHDGTCGVVNVDATGWHHAIGQRQRQGQGRILLNEKECKGCGGTAFHVSQRLSEGDDFLWRWDDIIGGFTFDYICIRRRHGGGIAQGMCSLSRKSKGTGFGFESAYIDRFARFGFPDPTSILNAEEAFFFFSFRLDARPHLSVPQPAPISS
jgi:hypothetical protein